jgi:aspartate-semialdehyde dehydrogenase
MGQEQTRGHKIAILGATGAVGRTVLEVLEGRKLPIAELRLLASERSAGQELEFRGEPIRVERVTAEAFRGCQVAIFSAGAAAAREWAPRAAAEGCVVVDNSSAFRMERDVPLVVPEVNADALAGAAARRIVANPNCSTIQMVVALKPIMDAAGLERVVVATYQSVSGAGQKGIWQLERESSALMNGREPEPPQPVAHRIAFNAVPHIGAFTDNGYTEEEMKLVNESRKILGQPGLKVSATAVRVPVFYCHSESVNVQTRKKLSAADARELLRKAPGVKVVDAPADKVYPMPMLGVNDDAVLVGRIREDLSQENGLELFVVSDNLRKGAATNAVQIAERLLGQG